MGSELEQDIEMVALPGGIADQRLLHAHAWRWLVRHREQRLQVRNRGLRILDWRDSMEPATDTQMVQGEIGSNLIAPTGYHRSA